MDAGAHHQEEPSRVRPFLPEAGDRLLLASDGLTNHVTPDDLREQAQQFAEPQAWADHLVRLALSRASTLSRCIRNASSSLAASLLWLKS